MRIDVVLLSAGLLTCLAGAALVIWLGYRWGRYAALKAIVEDGPKWKAYVLALLPPAALGVALLFDGISEPFAYRTFCVLSVPALMGTCVRINHSSYSTF